MKKKKKIPAAGQQPHMRRLRSEEVHNVTSRAASMPQPCERTQRTTSDGAAGNRGGRSGGSGKSGGGNPSSSYPLTAAPPDAASEPDEFRVRSHAHVSFSAPER